MSSFQQLFERLESQRSDLSNDKSLDAIRSGMNIKEDFWDDFLMLINNSGALSDLLDIPVTKISSWHEKIKNGLEKVKEADGEVREKKELIKTGLPEIP